MIVTFEPWHLAAIKPQQYQIGSDQSSNSAYKIARIGAFTCLDDGAPIAMGGLVEMSNYGLVFDKGVAQAWMLISENIMHKWPEIYRATRRELLAGLKKYHRIEATTAFDQGERFLSMLGMHYEGRLMKYNTQGKGVSLWAVTR